MRLGPNDEAALSSDPQIEIIQVVARYGLGLVVMIRKSWSSTKSRVQFRQVWRQTRHNRQTYGDVKQRNVRSAA